MGETERTIITHEAAEMAASERMKHFIVLMDESIGEIGARDLAHKLQNIGFFSSPASTCFHGCYPGGLYDHSAAVTRNLLKLTNNLGLKWELNRSPYIVGMLHDICKCHMYTLNEAEGKYEYKKDPIIPGHGERSVIIAHILGVVLTIEEIMCIRWHMGAFDDRSMWNSYGHAIEQYQNVLFTHTADMMATRIDGV